MHNYPLPRFDVEDSQSAIDEDSPQVEVVDETPQVANHNLAYDDVARPANIFDTPPPLEVEKRAMLLVVGARVGAEDGVGAAFVYVVADAAASPAIAPIAALVVVVVARAQRQPRRVPRQPS
jgi:hypothetical protein